MRSICCLRGWGDSAPAMYPYEMVGWGGLDRYVAYASAALGDPALAMRTRDALAALAYLRTRPEVEADRIVVCGRGLGGIVALHVAACDERVSGVIVWEGLISFRSLLEAEAYAWPADAFWPGILLRYDLPELAEALACPVRILGRVMGRGIRWGRWSWLASTGWRRSSIVRAATPPRSWRRSLP